YPLLDLVHGLPGPDQAWASVPQGTFWTCHLCCTIMRSPVPPLGGTHVLEIAARIRLRRPHRRRRGRTGGVHGARDAARGGAGGGAGRARGRRCRPGRRRGTAQPLAEAGGRLSPPRRSRG